MSKASAVPRRHALKLPGAATVAPAVAKGAWMFHPLVPPQEHLPVGSRLTGAHGTIGM